jgi:hypothetical protein
MPNIRFYRRFPLIPGLLYLNISKNGFSITFGKNGLTVNFGKNGIRFTGGMPGTGLSVSEHINYHDNR